MGVELSSEQDLERRIEARRHVEHLRAHVRCRKCKKFIPDGVRRDAVYCSIECNNKDAWRERNILRAEIRGMVRELQAPKNCACGAPLDNRPGRRGPVAKSCKRCRDRIAARRYRERRANDAAFVRE